MNRDRALRTILSLASVSAVLAVSASVGLASPAAAQVGESSQVAEDDSVPPPATILAPGGSAPNAQATEVAPVAPPVVDLAPGTALRVQTLQNERAELRLHRPKLLAPLLMTVFGVLAVGAAIPLMRDNSCADEYGRAVSCGWTAQSKGGVALLAGGAALATAGLAFLTVRIIQRRRHALALKRIDEELSVLTAQAGVSPWFSVHAGLALGVTARLSL